jgi:hypothetical protein
MSRYDYPDPSLDPSYCDGLTADDSPNEPSDPYRCFWCDTLLTRHDMDYCSAQCANYALTDDCER